MDASVDPRPLRSDRLPGRTGHDGRRGFRQERPAALASMPCRRRTAAPVRFFPPMAWYAIWPRNRGRMVHAGLRGGARRLLYLRRRPEQRRAFPSAVRARACRGTPCASRKERASLTATAKVPCRTLPKLPANSRRARLAGLRTLDMHARPMRSCLLRGGAHLPRRAWLSFILYLPPVDRSLRYGGGLYARRSQENLLPDGEDGGTGWAGASFTELESQCTAIREDFVCGCPPGAPIAEDGASPGPGQHFEAACTRESARRSSGGVCSAERVRATQAKRVAHPRGPTRTACTCANACPVTLDDAGAQVAIGCMP